jgi:hypothetical protein
MLGRKPKQTPEQIADYRDTFRFGKFDDSGYVTQMEESNSKNVFTSLAIDPRTKPFKYPLEEIGYIDVYLMGAAELKREYSYDGMWLSADLCYTNFELAGSLIGKLSEIYQRVGEIKSSLGDEFSLKANLFLVIMCILGGVALFYAIGRLIFT